MDTHNHSHSSHNTTATATITTSKQQQHWAKTYKHFGLEQTETLLSPSSSTGSSNPFRAAHQRSLVNRILGFENWIRCSRPCCRQTEGRTDRRTDNSKTKIQIERERDAAISSTLSNLPTPTQHYSPLLLPMPAAALAMPRPTLPVAVNINCIIEHCGLPQTCNWIAPFRPWVQPVHLSNCPLDSHRLCCFWG